MTAHAVLSASASHRWLACPPSAQLERQFPSETSSYAEEGTFAHALAELKLSRAMNLIKPSTFKKRLAEMKKDPNYSAGLEEYVDQYVSQVGERFMESKKSCKDTLVLLEQRLDFSGWVPDGFGTGDVVIIGDDVIEIIDLKYGKGVPVSADGNPQTRLYGLGAISSFEMLYDFSKVKMTIIQPRLDNTSTEEMTVDELLAWADEYLVPRAEQAAAGEGEHTPGEHCRFCRAKAVCRARAEENLKLAQYDFKKPALLDDGEITDILAKVEELQKWAEDVQKYAFDQALNHGKKWPGWKLVEGRSNRKYSDEEAVAKILKQAGYSDEDIYKPKELLGITAMEKVTGKDIFNQLLSKLIIKPAGKPTLVPESDKRPEINTAASAAEDFSDMLD
jgi:hypothetical protein